LEQFWAEPPERLLEKLGASPGGLTSGEASDRLARHGRNSLAERPAAGVVRLFLRQFSNPFVLVLVGAAGVAALVHEPVDSGLIVAILVGSALLTLSQEYRAGRAVQALRDLVVHRVPVIRDGVEADLPSEELVPGDIVLLSAGTMIPGDGVVLEARDLYVNQSVLTGEAFPVEKAPGTAPRDAPLSARTNVAFMGTSVRSGTGRMLVVRTGMETAFGAVSRKLTLRPPETEFERGIRRFGYLLTRVIVLLVGGVFAANVFLDRPPVESLLFAVALAVGISPELLPAIISVTLARGARGMAREGVVVRRLNAIEDFGSMDVLCCDKTGTLTEGSIRLEGALDAEGDPSEAVFAMALANARLQTGIVNPLDEAITRAGPDAVPEEPSQGAGSTGAATPQGALMETLSALAVPRKLDEIPYDFVRRRMTVVVEQGTGARLLTKGALDSILEVSTRVRRPGGRVEPLDADGRNRLLARLEEWSAEGFRVLGVSTRDLPLQSGYGRTVEAEMVFEGFLLFQDRPKEGVREVLDGLRELGVQVSMITGDNRFAARHVAEQVGLDGASMLTGSELDGLRDEALWRLAPETRVFAEVDPNQKERIISALQRSGHVVGFMGDGINDAPALYAADVGISVEGAVDVARESADLVLLRQDLEVLRRGIRSGRTIFANTLKYIHITTSANFGNMVSMAVASLFLPFLPLLATQILLTNFLSDVPALAIAGDRVDESWVERPRRWEIEPIKRFMLLFGLVSSAFDFLTFGLLLWVFSAGAELFRTGWFVLSMLTELVILFVARTRGPLYRSRPATGLVVAALATGAVTLSLPFVAPGQLFQFVPLPPVLLVSLLGVAMAYGMASELAKRHFYGWVDRQARRSYQKASGAPGREGVQIGSAR
jgi:P-type Mg2+ transporter